MSIDAFYFPAASGQRFCLFHQPEARITRRGAVVYVHPFAEELNKSRRMAAMQARAMASAGYSVLQIDLHGCGDSSGDFGDAAWEDWVSDVVLACGWMQQRCDSDLWLWGLRTGCLLVSEAAARIEVPSQLLLWQPVLSGKQFLQQFLRLKIASKLLGSNTKGSMDRLREQLANGESVEIAGYQLSPEMAAGLDRAELVLPDQSKRIEWFQLSGKPDGELSLSASATVEQWQLARRKVTGRLVLGPAFWQTAEIAECPALIDATLLAMAGANPE